MQPSLYGLSFFLSPTLSQPTGIIEWVYLTHSPSKSLTPYPDAVATLLAKAHYRLKQLIGQEPAKIIVPFTLTQQGQLWGNSPNWQIALANFPGQIDNHYPQDKLIPLAITTSFVFLQL